MNPIKKFIVSILKKLPLKYYKLIANGFIIIPKYYKSQVIDLEKYMNLSAENSPKKDLFMMRKYGHILDKGLHRSDVTPGHSAAIYSDLKRILDSLVNTECANDPTYKWALSKLETYESLQVDPANFVPLKGNAELPSISYEDFMQLSKSRRSNRSFKNESIGTEEVIKLKEALNWAASSCNKQPITAYVATDPELAKECLSCCKGGTGFSDFIPSFWAFTANCRGYVWPSEMYLPTLDTALGVQNMFLAATTLGLSGTILSWAQKDQVEEDKLRKLLNIPSDDIIIMCAVIGKAENIFSTPIRKAVTI